MPNPVLLGLALALFVLILAPTRRLQLAGWPSRALGSYLVSMLLLGLIVAELHGPTRYLVPLFVAGYVLPFIIPIHWFDRLFGRTSRANSARTSATDGAPRTAGWAPRRPGRFSRADRSGRPMKTVVGVTRDVPPDDGSTAPPPAANA